jgi:hypothetical protein
VRGDEREREFWEMHHNASFRGSQGTKTMTTFQSDAQAGQESCRLDVGDEENPHQDSREEALNCTGFPLLKGLNPLGRLRVGSK